MINLVSTSLDSVNEFGFVLPKKMRRNEWARSSEWALELANICFGPLFAFRFLNQDHRLLHPDIFSICTLFGVLLFEFSVFLSQASPHPRLLP
jgi:hypothetical protein